MLGVTGMTRDKAAEEYWRSLWRRGNTGSHHDRLIDDYDWYAGGYLSGLSGADRRTWLNSFYGRADLEVDWFMGFDDAMGDLNNE